MKIKKNFAFHIYALLALIFVAGCGPKEIGEGSSYYAPIPQEASAADIMRYPVTGMNKTQKLLYWHNKPDVMESVQNWKLGLIRKHMGIAPSPEDPAYREIPKQRSPFRQ